MTTIYRPTTGAESWREFLAKPELHWKTGYSARALAYCWEEAGGLPPEIAGATELAFGGPVEPLIVIPEYKVSLPGGRAASQNDVFALIGCADAQVVTMVEGKVEEPFGPTIGEWMERPSPGKRERLSWICQLLGLAYPPSPALRYQLFHRTASAVMEASRFRVDKALMLVHSFSRSDAWLEDYAAFVTQFGCPGRKGIIERAHLASQTELYFGWVAGDPCFLSA